MSSESTCFWLQYDPSITSVACSQTELSISEKTLGDQVKGRSPKKLETLIQVAKVVYVQIHDLCFTMILTSPQQHVHTPTYPIREELGDKVKSSSLKKPIPFIEVPIVCLVKVHVFSFNIILLPSPQRFPRPSYPFRRNFGRSGKGSFTENAKIIN